MSDLHRLRDMLDAAAQSMVPADLKAKGWRYQDFNTVFSPEAWDYLLRLIGDDEYKIIAYSEGVKNGKPFKRGQLFISPQGCVNLGDKERREAIPFPEPEPAP